VSAAAHAWDRLVPADELDQLAANGFGELQGIGRSPCLLVIDVVTSFLGPRPGSDEPETPMSCGEMGWRALPTIVALVDLFRAHSLPVVFTKGDLQDKIFCGGSVKRTSGATAARAAHDVGFPPELVPGQDEYVLSKPKASAFFGTPLVSYLLRHGIDSLVMVGTTTSGCVRASAVDASANNLKVVVVEDACFDRSPFAHAANLFDIHMKYGDVLTAEETGALVAEHAAQGAP
jgi:maleamate amidohydrolase